MEKISVPLLGLVALAVSTIFIETRGFRFAAAIVQLQLQETTKQQIEGGSTGCNIAPGD